MLIIDEFNSELKDKIKEFNCIMCVFQIFLDNEDKSIFRLNGEHPLIFTDFSHCIIEKRLPYAIRILDKYFLDACNISNGQEVKLLYYDRLSKWKREDFGNFVYLISESNYFPFDASTNRYRISYNINSTTFNISKS